MKNVSMGGEIFVTNSLKKCFQMEGFFWRENYGEIFCDKFTLKNFWEKNYYPLFFTMDNFLFLTPEKIPSLKQIFFTLTKIFNPLLPTPGKIFPYLDSSTQTLSNSPTLLSQNFPSYT